MNFYIVLSAPPSDFASTAALNTCRCISTSSHTIEQVFLHSQAVMLGRRQYGLCETTKQWQAFIEQTNTDIVLCSNSAMQHDVIDENISAGFEIAGLGMLSAAVASNAKILTFNSTYDE